MMATLQTLLARWQGLGLRLDPLAARDAEVYCGDASAWVWLALRELGDSAPVLVLLALLEARGYPDPERILLDAVTDSSGGYAWYRLAVR
jgi:hypothetical protein